MNLRIALFRCATDPRPEDQSSVDWAAREVQRFLRDLCPEWSVEVRGWVLPILENSELPSQKTYSEDAIWRLRQADPSIDAFAPTHFHVWGNVSFQYCGWAPLGGTHSMTFAECGPRTMCHEILHSALSLRHCTDMTDSGAAEYSRKSHCVMGKSFDGLCAAHRIKAGLITPSVINQGEFLLTPVEFDPEDCHADEHRAVQFGDLLISARRVMPGVVTVQDISRIKPVYLAGLRVGDSAHGVTVLDERDQTFRISLGGGEVKFLHDGFPEATGTCPPGIYMDARFRGHGVAVWGDQCRLFCFAPKRELGQDNPSRDWFDFEGRESAQHQLSDGLLRLNLPGHGRCSFRLAPMIQGDPREDGNRLLWRWHDTEVGFEIGRGPHEFTPTGQRIEGSDKRWWVLLGDRRIEAVGPAFRRNWDVTERDV